MKHIAAALALLGIALLLTPLPHASGAPSAGEVKAAQKAFAAQAKLAQAEYRAALGRAAAGLPGDLGDALAEFLDFGVAPLFLVKVIDAMTSAHDAAIAANFIAVRRMEAFGDGILDDLGEKAVPGLTVGDGGVLDRFHLGLQKDLDKYNKSVAKAVAKFLKTAKKAVPEGVVVACVARPLQNVEMADVNQDPAFTESGFTMRHALVLVGCGTGTSVTVGFLGVGTAQDVMNVYSGDGELLVDTLPTTGQGSTQALHGGVIALPGLPNAHGHVKLEIFRPGGSGWTFPIGF